MITNTKRAPAPRQLVTAKLPEVAKRTLGSPGAQASLELSVAEMGQAGGGGGSIGGLHFVGRYVE